jgi:hypothetical protein
LDIGFQNAKDQTLFNDYNLLQSRYGRELANKIANRMAMLKAARHLGMIDRGPPILLAPINGSAKQYSVSLKPPRRLRFAAAKAESTRSRELDLSQVQDIEILGVD